MGPSILVAPEERLDLKESDIPIRNIWHMLLYAWNEPPSASDILLQNEEEAPTLDTLLSLILIRLIQQRFRIGLGRNYLDENHIIKGIRGQVNFGESLKKNLFYKGQAFCRFQEFSINVPKNQIIRTTLQRMVMLGNFGTSKSNAQEVCQRLRRASMTMDGVDIVELSLEFINRQQLGRNDRDYRIMLAICRLLLQRFMPLSNVGQSPLPFIDTFGLLLHDVYEKFVANFYKYHLLDWRVDSQKILEWNERLKNQYLPIMKPDLVLEEKSSKRTIVLDTKFTPQTVMNQFGSEKFQSSHLYQMYAYLKTQEELSDQKKLASGILLYPRSIKNNINTCIELLSHTINISCIDLSKPWQDIERDLLNIVKEN
jgi:5-methylcytosine-specific restriction enzyme subunit McrC